jgi:hypothetical protein
MEREGATVQGKYGDSLHSYNHGLNDVNIQKQNTQYPAKQSKKKF